VLFSNDEIDLPLKQAADNLKLAEIEMKDGRLEQLCVKPSTISKTMKNASVIIEDMRPKLSTKKSPN